MRLMKKSIVVLAGVIGLVTRVAAGNGGLSPIVPDMPNVPPQVAPVMIAQVHQAQGGNLEKIRTLGVCQPVPNELYSLENDIDPIRSAEIYFQLYEKQEIQGGGTITILQQPHHGNLRLVTEADGDTFGTGRFDSSNPGYIYLPEKGYVGKDKAIVLVEIGAVKVKVVYFLHAIEGGLGNYGGELYCGKTGPFWKISSTLDANGNSTITSVEYQSPVITATATIADTTALASTLESGILSSLALDTSAITLDTSAITLDTSAITLNIANLPGGSVGQTTGNNITLDANAAGYNWFIDTTPADNSEFLPTSNPNEWVAKEGTAAFGKMDMLSVLLHEYGHALGIEHSADGHDYMGTTLTPGVRRLPSATELALMQQLIGEAKNGMAASPSLTLEELLAMRLGGQTTPTKSLVIPQGERGSGDAPTPFPTLPISLGGLAFAGLLRPNRFGGMNIDLVSAITPAPVPRPLYEVSANATFTSLNTASGWNTQGSVDIVSSTGTGPTGTATLNEVSTSQTRLSQVFMLGDRDRYLSFTLSGLPLPNPLPEGEGAIVTAFGSGYGPSDAFEVALLDANTGLSVLGTDGLTRTDAFLNLQGDGTQHTANSVTCIVNADGSRTYRVDLTGVAKNIAVNLSFDLLGFGQSNSHVTLRDIRVSGLPQLHDEVASIAEDNLLTFNPFAQIDAPSPTGGGLGWGSVFASHIVTAPTHGVLAMNTNGTFSYTPTLNFFGADSFSYRLSDGPLDSNLATVSLTVTPVNDAPVAADAQVTTAEDTPLVIALGAYASDVDTPSLSGGGLGVGVGLTTSIVTGPAHGVLTQNADGTYNYAPVANYNGGDSFTYKVNDGLLDSNIATAMSTLK
jgi:hypothetical protein